MIELKSAEPHLNSLKPLLASVNELLRHAWACSLSNPKGDLSGSSPDDMKKKNKDKVERILKACQNLLDKVSTIVDPSTVPEALDSLRKRVDLLKSKSFVS